MIRKVKCASYCWPNSVHCLRWVMNVAAPFKRRSVYQFPSTGQKVASRRMDRPGPRPAAQWKRTRFHGPYLAGAPCNYMPEVRRHAASGVIPENWLNAGDPIGMSPQRLQNEGCSGSDQRNLSTSGVVLHFRRMWYEIRSGLFGPRGNPDPTVSPAQRRSLADGGRDRRAAPGGDWGAVWERLATETRKGVALPESANLPLETASRAPGKWMFMIRMPNGRTLKHGFDGTQGWEDRGRVASVEPDADRKSVVYGSASCVAS